MPRRNLLLLAATLIVSAMCYAKADSAHRSRYGRMFNTFVQLLEKIETRYVEPVDERELFEGALHGTVAALDDPNSAYYSPRQAQASRSQLEQQFGGIGIELTWDRATRQLTIVTPLVGSPAEMAGVLPGDKIIEIDGQGMEDITFDDAARRLRGKPGTIVRLKLLREGQDDAVDVALRRAIIKTETVVGYRRTRGGTSRHAWDYFLPGTDRVAYVRVTLFGKNTAEELKSTLESLKQQHMTGLVLDLRNNGGGLLQAAQETCNLFIHEGVIVSTRGRDGRPLDVRRADGTGPLTDVPVAVLINRFSASASEIVAACLQDHQRATIVGTRSYGKGTVQDVLLLEDGISEVRLTIATYWRPSGKNIHRSRSATDRDEWGVLPDPGDDVPLSDKQWSEIVRDRARRSHVNAPAVAPKADEPTVADPQLDRAVEALQADR
ncbi:MAG TPA: S41 family peptidase [Pirellulales bacterium]|nr:S41 family peptidase [Pirellulales bacterium]